MKIQISFSTRCNINCKFCLRKVLRDRYNYIENIDMEIEVAKKVLDQGVKKLFICGNKGEAIFHPQIDDILKYAKEKGIIIDFITNAYYKSPQWWADLAKLFIDIGDTVTFPLDGVGNKIHNRHRGSDFYTVLRNIESFINAGGNAIWKFIKFEHNQHQAELARTLSKEIGCYQFVLMNSHTYDSELREPTDGKVWTVKNITDEAVQECDYLPCEDKTYYVSTRGLLFPCCFIANIFSHKPMIDHHYERNFVKIFNDEKDLLDLRNNSIEYIVKNSEFFKQAYTKNSHICKQACLKWTRNMIIERKDDDNITLL